MKSFTCILSGIALLSLALIQSACSGLGHVAKPDVDLPDNYVGAVSPDSTTIADLQWWEFYADTTLCGIIRHTLDHNRDILKAAATVEELRQLYGIDKLNLTPTVTGIAGATHETNDYYGEAFKKDPEYSLKATVAWGIKLWGALSWARKQGKAKFEASREDLRAMRMTLISEAASTYFRLLALDNELTIVRRTLATRLEALEQARLRFEGGLTSETVFQQAKVEYASAASLVPDLERRIAICRNALTLLMGEYPGEHVAMGSLDLDITLPADLPAGVPSELLKRRPDIRAAELRLAAAMANVGLTYADRFPSLRIAFTGGLENDDLSHFFKSPFTYALGNITGTIFDFGRKKRKYQASIAACDRARYDYEQTVMEAFTEVSDAIITYRKVHEASALRSELREAARKYVELARLQYRAGTLAYLDVLDAQRRFFDAQIGVNNALRDEYLALINLYKALGGGWNSL